jgi:sterol desaturase/sphingolipid hydroxylase (fatty acid hydroxylase superfamily)
MSVPEAIGWEPWKFLVLLTTFWHALWVVFANFFFYVLYHFNLLEQYKVNPNPWPWKKDKEEWNKMMWKSIGNILFNGFVTLPLVQIGGMALNGYVLPFGFKTDDIPDWKRFGLNMIFCMYCEDMIYHWTHRFLHTGPIYTSIHKVHHEFSDTVGLATEYTHPLDYFFTGILPSSLSCALLGPSMHFTSVLSFTFLRVWETFDLHCGFETPWSPYRLLPFASSAEYHDFHHSHNLGNFSSMFSLWDTIYAKNTRYFEYYRNNRKKV